MSENLRIYEQARAVPQEAQKAFNNGRFSGTDINPMWRIKKLTELFGPVGFGWYTEVISQRSERLDDDTLMATVDIHLYVWNGEAWSKPIYGTGANTLVSKTKSGRMVSDEGYKMAYTDALSVACKALGIGANVYWDKDPTKYTTPQQKPQQKPQKPQQPPAQPPQKQMATADQIQYIIDNADDATYQSAMEAFGANLEKMTFKQAIALMGRINNGR